jgi:type I restriction enzyme, R subunit
VAPPYGQTEYFGYFAGTASGDFAQLKATEPQRLALYKLTAALVRAYANLASEMAEAGYTAKEAAAIKAEVTKYEQIRSEVKQYSGDNLDMKQHEPAMRHLIDTYIDAAASEKVSEFEDLSLVQLIVQRGAGAIAQMPEGLRKSHKTIAETIENNVGKVIVEATPVNPKYYERMSELLNALIEQRREGAIEYQAYLAQIIELTKQVHNGPAAGGYPLTVGTKSLRAIYDNIGRNESLAVGIDTAVRSSIQDGWRDNAMKTRRVQQAVRNAIAAADPATVVDEAVVDRIVALVKSQHDY